MTAPIDRDRYYQELLYNLLPGVYRGRDKDRELERFIGVFGHALARQRGNIDQFYRDLFIDSCQDWVIPYLGDLIDANLVFQRDSSRTRAEVRSTMKWRRQKGTRNSIGDLAVEVGGWGAYVTELYSRLIWSQHLASIRPNALHAVDLAEGTSLSRIATPFDTSTRSVDLRPGGHQIRNVSVAFWPIPARPRAGAEAVREATGHWRFDPLGRDVPLMAAQASGESDADAMQPGVRDTWIRLRDLADNPSSYLNAPWGFTIREDGIPLCTVSGTTTSAPSVATAETFFELARDRGIIVAAGVTGSPQFRVSVMRLAARTTTDSSGTTVLIAGSPTGPLAAQLQFGGLNGDLDTATLVYSKGIPYNPGSPSFHRPYVLLRIERTGPDTNFPECEIILRNASGSALLVYLPAIAAIASGAQHHLYVANDGSTYFARGDHGPGDPDLNPNSDMLGALLPRHLARGSLGQVRPLPGIRPVQFRTLVARQLCCFDALRVPPAPGELAVDPTRGRFAVPNAEDPTGVVTVDYHFGFTGETGAGPYYRGEFDTPTLVVSRAGDAQHATVQSAITAAPAIASPVIIEIADSATYNEALVVNRPFPGGLILRARGLQMPVVRSPGGNVLNCAQAAPFLRIDGLTLAGGAVRVSGDVPLLHVRFTTLDPATAGVNYVPSTAGAELRLESSVTGRVISSANVDRTIVQDTAVQSVGADPALNVASMLSMECSTVVGTTQAAVAEVSNSILFGPLQVTDGGASCLRYSRHPKDAAATRRFRTTTAWPVFLSLRFGDPGFLHLAPNTSSALLDGAEDGGEMGVFFNAAVPSRERAVFLKIDEYLPAGLRAGLVRVLPPRHFSGVIQP